MVFLRFPMGFGERGGGWIFGYWLVVVRFRLVRCVLLLFGGCFRIKCSRTLLFGWNGWLLGMGQLPIASLRWQPWIYPFGLAGCFQAASMSPSSRASRTTRTSCRQHFQRFWQNECFVPGHVIVKATTMANALANWASKIPPNGEPGV